MTLFCCGLFLDSQISYSTSYDLLSLLRDGSSRWSNPTRSPERLHLIISDSLQGLGRDGLQLPPIDVPAWRLMSSDSSQLRHFHSRNVQQMFSWVRLHLQFIHLPLFPFHYNLLQSPEPWGSCERLCSENGQRDSKSVVQNVVATLKNYSKKHLSVAVAGWTSHRGGEHFTHGRCSEGNWWTDIARAAYHISQTLLVDCMARLSEPKNDVNVFGDRIASRNAKGKQRITSNSGVSESQKTEASSLWNTWSRPDGQWWSMRPNALVSRNIKHPGVGLAQHTWKTRCRNRLWGISTWRCCAHRRCRCPKQEGTFSESDSNIKQQLLVSVRGKWLIFFHAHFMHISLDGNIFEAGTLWQPEGSCDINTLIGRVKAAGVGSPWQDGVQVLDSAGVDVHLENQWKSTFNDLSWKVTSYDSIWHGLSNFQLPLADFLRFSSTATGAFDRWITTKSTRLGFLSGGAMSVVDV